MANKTLHVIAFILLIVGGLNWLLFAIVGWDIGQLVFGDMMATFSRVIYVLVGLAAVYELVTHKGNCRMCLDKKM